MATFKNNVIRSFDLAKRDIITLFNHVNALHNEVKYLKRRNLELQKRLVEMNIVLAKKKHRTIKRRITKTANKYVSSRTSNKVHSTDCAFAKNIKSKNKRVFSSKDAAFSDGYKACSCVV
tara:strand:- start:1086 stop:1445 length:360 start_codon:yes stop_codon:yes gene_type:complete